MAVPRIDEIYEIEDETFFHEEDLRRYKPGGYHPVKLGDVFNQRYRIHNKLGHGGRSTVWLARDGREDRWVSLKIKIADLSTSPTTPKLDEFEAIQRLRQSERWGTDPGSRKIVTVLDKFTIRGPNGDHECLVFELLGPSVATVLNNASEVDLDLAECFTVGQILSISTQLLQAVKFMHSVGISQGDISVSNIAFSWDRLSQLSEKDLLKLVGRPVTTQVRRQDGSQLDAGVPQMIMTAVNWWNFPKSKMSTIKVIDFGEAFEGTIDSRRLAQPIPLKSPESIILGRVGLKADLWRIGSVIYHLCVGCDFLGNYSDVMLMEGMIWLLAKLPPGTPGDLPQGWPRTWCSEWNRIRNDAASKGTYKPMERVPEPELKQDFFERLQAQRSHSALNELWPIIESLLNLLPEQRMTATHALSLVEKVAQKSHSR